MAYYCSAKIYTRLCMLYIWYYVYTQKIRTESSSKIDPLWILWCCTRFLLFFDWLRESELHSDWRKPDLSPANDDLFYDWLRGSELHSDWLKAWFCHLPIMISSMIGCEDLSFILIGWRRNCYLPMMISDQKSKLPVSSRPFSSSACSALSTWS